jgi:hypothetical protein
MQQMRDIYEINATNERFMKLMQPMRDIYEINATNERYLRN